MTRRIPSLPLRRAAPAPRSARGFTLNVYTANAAALGYATLPAAVNSSGSTHYDLSVTVGTPATTFVATATPTGAQMRDTTCYAFRVDHLGVQSNVDSGNAALAGTGCW